MINCRLLEGINKVLQWTYTGFVCPICLIHLGNYSLWYQMSEVERRNPQFSARLSFQSVASYPLWTHFYKFLIFFFFNFQGCTCGIWRFPGWGLGKWGGAMGLQVGQSLLATLPQARIQPDGKGSCKGSWEYCLAVHPGRGDKFDVFCISGICCSINVY